MDACMHFVSYHFMLSHLRYQVCFYVFKIGRIFYSMELFFHLMVSLCEVRLLKLSSEDAPADG
jgi:hypothetical protein